MSKTPEIEEIMQGTVLLRRGVGKASKLGAGVGWLVIADKGKPFTHPGGPVPALRDRPTNRLRVETKAEARKVLRDLEKQP